MEVSSLKVDDAHDVSDELNILHLEDNALDAELIQSLLKSEGVKCNSTVVSSRKDFESAITNRKFDLILSDFTLPSFDGNSALQIALRRCPDTPFIFVSGTIGEELAVESMRNGATDYVLKTRLQRLVPVINRALGEAEERRKLRQAEAEREKAIEELKASEARFRGLLEFAPDPTIIIDAKEKIIFSNQRTEEVFGYSHAELIGGPMSLLIPERYRKMHEGQVADYHGSPHSRPMGTGLELFGRRKDGTEFSADIMLAPLKVENEFSVLAIIRDVTSSKLAARALRESEERYHQMFDSSPLPMWVFDPDTLRFLAVNDAAISHYGYARKEFMQMTVRDIRPEDDVPAFLDFLSKNRRFDERVKVWRHRKKDGSIINVEIKSSTIAVGSETGVLILANDVTERQKAATALRESEERLRTIYELSPLGILRLDSSGYFLQCNPAATVIFGYSSDELTKMTVGQLTHPQDDAISYNFLADLEASISDLVEFEKRYIKKDGSEIWAHLTAAAVRDSQGAFLYTVTVLEDVTDRKNAEAALRRSEEQYRSLVESARDAIFSLAPDGEIKSLNSAFNLITEWDRSQWIGKQFLSLLHPADREKAASNFRRVMSDEPVGVSQYRILTKSGKYLTGEFSTTAEVIDGRAIGILGIARDVSAQKKMEEYFRQVQKMESLGTLAGGIAHDFNNILGIILGFVGLIERTGLKDDRMERYTDSINAATNRGIALVRQLLTFARKEDKSFDHIKINEVVQETFKLAKETFPKNIEINLTLGEGIPIIVADQSQIHQAILNLCVNARDAMLDRSDGKPSGGILGINTRVVTGDAVKTRFPRADFIEYVLISVSDTGVGIDEPTRSRIFEPFFTTKERGKGTGLGLATVYGVVESHDGFIDVSSQVGIGSTFSIYLPSRPVVESETKSSDPTNQKVRGGSETIMVVEDEELLRELLESVLTDNGYRVITAEDGEKAIAAFEKNKGNVQLVLSDLGLPKLGGSDMLNALRKINSEIRVLFASGFVESRDKEWMTQNEVDGFIAKPYRIAEVLKKVREVLDRK